MKKNGNVKFHIADPASPTLLVYTKEEFCRCWVNTHMEGEDAGMALLLEPSPEFFKTTGRQSTSPHLRSFLKYLTPYKKELLQVIAGMLVASGLQLLLPFLTQALVDTE